MLTRWLVNTYDIYDTYDKYDLKREDQGKIWNFEPPHLVKTEDEKWHYFSRGQVE